MKKTLLTSCVFALWVQGAIAASCASLPEKRSIEMRALQSELMVAALACGKKSEYNQYVHLFSTDLKWQGKQLHDYFKRNYGTKSDRALNKFVTQMANQASRLSLTLKSADYCQQATQLFEKMNTSLPWQVADYASSQYANWHGVQRCDAKQVVAAAQ